MLDLRTIRVLIFLTGLFPLAGAIKANRATALLPTLIWGAAAWVFWAGALVPSPVSSDGALLRYFALSLTACTAVAVLGARRPGVAAWNFVVVALLAVLGMAVAENQINSTLFRLTTPRAVLVGAVLAVGVLNHLPTALGPAALLLGIGCGTDILTLTGDEALLPRTSPLAEFGRWCLAVILWVGFIGARWGQEAPTEFDQAWLQFRNRFGLMWGQRLREQFNRSAANNGWPVVLYWQGLRRQQVIEQPEPEMQASMLAALRALMKRFMPISGNPG